MFSIFFLLFLVLLLLSVINNHERQWKEPFAVAGTYLFSLLFYFSNDLVFVAHEMSVDFRLLLSFALDLSIFGSEIPPNGRNQSLGD